MKLAVSLNQVRCTVCMDTVGCEQNLCYKLQFSFNHGRIVT